MRRDPLHGESKIEEDNEESKSDVEENIGKPSAARHDIAFPSVFLVIALKLTILTE